MPMPDENPTDLAAPSRADERTETAGSNANQGLLRPLQGGADGLPDGGPTIEVTYGMLRYEDGRGPLADLRLPRYKSAGLSGLPEADAGIVPPQWGDPDAPKGATGPQKAEE